MCSCGNNCGGACVSNCVNGLNAFTITTSSFVQPNVSSNVTVNVSNITPLNNQWAAIGQIIYIAGGGYYQVVSVPSLTSVVVQNLGYAGNAAPGVTVPAAGLFTPGGLVGPNGQAGTSGTSVLINDHSAVSQVNQGNTDLFTYVLPLNTMSVDEDALEIEFYASRLNIPNNNPAVVSFLLNGGSIGIGAGLNNYNECKAVRFRILLSRTSATAVSAMVQIDWLDITDFEIASTQFYLASIAINNLTTNSNTFAVNGAIVNVSPAQTLTGEYLLIKLCKK